ncbi:hypothetical protein [Stigmatella hybrida]|nr:hypothetical protein [Stigmatella hybrida]
MATESSWGGLRPAGAPGLWGQGMALVRASHISESQKAVFPSP